MISVNRRRTSLHRHSTENLYFLYILSNGSLLIATLKIFKSIGCEIRKLLYIALRNHTNKKVPHGAILILMLVDGSDEIGYFPWKFQSRAMLT